MPSQPQAITAAANAARNARYTLAPADVAVRQGCQPDARHARVGGLEPALAIQRKRVRPSAEVRTPWICMTVCAGGKSATRGGSP